MQLTLGEALSFTTAKLLTTKERLLQLCRRFVGADFPSQLIPYAANEIRSHILKAYPDLEGVLPPWAKGGGEQWESWLAEQVKEHGNDFTLMPLPVTIRKQILEITVEGPFWVTDSGVIERK